MPVKSNNVFSTASPQKDNLKKRKANEFLTVMDYLQYHKLILSLCKLISIPH